MKFKEGHYYKWRNDNKYVMKIHKKIDEEFSYVFYWNTEKCSLFSKYKSEAYFRLNKEHWIELEEHELVLHALE